MNSLKLCFFLLVSPFYQQDSIIERNIFSGGYLVVPEKECWRLNEVFIEAGSFKIKVSINHFDEYYASGDTIWAPFYVPEIEFFNDQSMILYKLNFLSVN